MEIDFGSSAPSHSWVTKGLRALKRGENIVEVCRRSDRPQDPLTGLKIFEFLNSTPFASMRQITTTPKIPRSTVLCYLKG
jgi:hypothetical protein